MSNDNSPAAYVARAQDSREADMVEMLDKRNAGEEYDGGDPQEALDNLALSAEVVRTVKIVLSTGGPHEELRAAVDADGYVTGVTFLAVWGSDRRESTVYDDSALYRYAVEVVEGMGL